MKFLEFRVALVCLLFALTCVVPVFGYNILLNTDFDGTTNWKDDPNVTAPLNARANPSGGLDVPLKATAWTKIFQRFDTPEANLQLKVAYSLSTDYQTAVATVNGSNPGVPFDSGTVMQITKVRVEPFSLVLKPGEFVALIVDPQAATVHYLVVSGDNSDPRTFSSVFTKLLEHEEKLFYLAFPPGSGTVTLTHASLKKVQPPSEN